MALLTSVGEEFLLRYQIRLMAEAWDSRRNVVAGVALDCRSKALLEEPKRDSDGCACFSFILSLQFRDSKYRNEH